MTPLAQARKNLADAHSASEKLRVEVAEGEKQIRLLSRIHARDDHRLVEVGREQKKRLTALREAMDRERAAQAALDRALTDSLLPDGAQDVAALPATHPIVLLPVRLETRFAQDQTGAPVLKVRIFPDELMADTHEPPLTAEERAAGMKYWRDGWHFELEREAWRTLVATYAAPRAAWIVRSLTPLNLTSRATGEPVFPDTEIRAHSWTRAAEARVLPDRWLVVAYRGRREMHRALGLRIQEPLALTLSPVIREDDEDDTVDVSGDGLRVEKELAWTIDYEEAVKAGMAVTLPIRAVEASRGFDRLIVMGVKSSLTAGEAGAQLSQLLDAHHYARGLAIVPQGTPTNNSAEAPSGYPFEDEDGATSFAAERGASLNGPASNGTLLARALGVSEDIMSHCSGSDLREQPNAHAMNEALWPATWGYFLGQMMDPVLTDEAVRLARGHFAAHVRGRGSLPAFRTGATPYGTLTVSSLNRWAPSATAGPVETQLAPLLRQLRTVWMEQVPRVPRVGATGNPDDDLVAVLGMDASTREVQARPTLGPQVQAQLFTTLNMNAAAWQARRLSIAQEVMTRLGHPEWNPRLASMSFADQAHRVRAPFITNLPLSETEPLQPFNYIRWIRTAGVAQLRQEQFPPDAIRPSALLYQLLRHAALSLYANTATKVGIKNNVLDRLDRSDPEMQGEVRGGQRITSVWDRLEMKIPNVTGNITLADFLSTDRNNEASKDIRSFRAALAELEGLPTAELDRLFTETLDVCSHRLDAWISSLPAKRLEEMRQRQPLGSHLGAFGWVEDLRPDATRPGVEPASTGGYIHAPSSTHAAAAAVLRSAYLTRSGQDGGRYAVDLSSARVRAGLELLDAVRQGQPLGAVLGYRFERGLHEGHRPLRLSKYIDSFRRLHPLVADKGGDSNEAVDAIAARNVVDGLLLRKAWQDNAIDWGQHGLPASGDDRGAIEAELRLLDDAVDAVTDLLTSESVFQLVRGNTEKASAVLDSIGQGLRPPEPEITLQPRGGTSLTHRVAVVLGGEAGSADGWAAVPVTPRAAVEPYLDAWVGSLMGNPTNVRCRLSFVDAAHQRIVREVSLQDLALRPLDILALAGSREGQPAASELDKRIASLAPEFATSVEIQYAADATWNRNVIRTFPDVLELARGLNVLLGGSRALEPKDLLPSSDMEDADRADLLSAEAEERAGLAEAALTDAKATLQAAIQSSPVNIATLSGALRAAAHLGVPDAFPGAPLAGETEQQNALMNQALPVMAELNRRVTALSAASGAVEKVRAVFGREFVFLPRFRCVNQEELALALNHGPALVGDASAVTKWMQQVSRVRTALTPWRQLSIMTGALNRPPLSLTAAQLPHAANARWVGLAFPTEEERPPSGCLSLVLHHAVTAATSEPWVGLLLDEWNEIIPNRTEDTAVAFHYDDPGAEAAQAILIAVPPTDAAQWDQATLLDILNETLDLAKMRAVDGELLPLGQLLPAIYLASNPAKDTVSTDLRPILQRAFEVTL